MPTMATAAKGKQTENEQNQCNCWLINYLKRGLIGLIGAMSFLSKIAR